MNHIVFWVCQHVNAELKTFGVLPISTETTVIDLLMANPRYSPWYCPKIRESTREITWVGVCFGRVPGINLPQCYIPYTLGDNIIIPICMRLCS